MIGQDSLGQTSGCLTESGPVSGGLWNLGWGVTGLCNMRCSYCYSATVRAAEDDLPLPDLVSFVDKNAALIASINYGTGENTLSDRWYRLVRHVRNKHPHIRQALTTNGFLAQAVRNDSRRREVVAECIDEVDVSMDGASAEYNSKTRGNPMAFDWALESLELVQQLGIPATIVFVGTQEVLGEGNLKGLVKMARRFGAFLRMNVLRFKGGEFANVPYDALKNALHYLASNTRLVDLTDPLLAAVFFRLRSEDPSGVRSARILHDGRISPATYLVAQRWTPRRVLDGLRLDSLGEEPVFREFQLSHTPAECVGCKVVDLCSGGTKDRRFLYHGSLTGRDPYCPFENEGRLPEAISWKSIATTVGVPRIHAGFLPTVVAIPADERSG